MKQKKYLMLLIPLLILTAFLLFRGNGSEKAFVKPKKSDVIEAVYGLGTVSAAKIFHLKIGVMSQIKKIFVEEGQEIKSGQPLVSFDSIPAIPSPISGIVTVITYKENEIAFPQMNILTVMDVSEKYITLSLEEQSVIKVRKGQKARIALEALKDRTFLGEVKSVYPGDNQFYIRISSKELPTEVLPGMTADIAIETGAKSNVFQVPEKSVKSGKMTVRKDGKTSEVKVKTGLKTDGWIEITEPVLSGEEEILSEKN